MQEKVSISTSLAEGTNTRVSSSESKGLLWTNTVVFAPTFHASRNQLVGRLVFHVFASIAQFERERISERTREGLEAARKRGKIGGRPRALNAAQADEVRRMRDEEARSINEIAGLFKVSAKTIRRV
ncbi:MAG: recombinase family protein [Paracoccus sp. (in: a-proteobacteria)]|nr:recombinase family protein [Paracoccus sp. (in: a-proteobacteria)]